MQFGQLKRREFITLLGGAAAAWPLAASAQQTAIPVAGFLNPGSPAAFSDLAAAFRRGLDEAGYVEGQNVGIEYRWAEGRLDRLPVLATDLVNHRVAVIASIGGDQVLVAAAAATSVIPIVFLGSDNALKWGVITSLARPSGNITGVAMSTSALLSKCLQFLSELVQKEAAIGVLVNPDTPSTIEDKKDIETASRQIPKSSSSSSISKPPRRSAYKFRRCCSRPPTRRSSKSLFCCTRSQPLLAQSGVRRTAPNSVAFGAKRTWGGPAGSHGSGRGLRAAPGSQLPANPKPAGALRGCAR